MSKKNSDTTPNFEEAIAALENIVRQMESDNLPLAQALDAYKRGAALVKICQQSLADAEQQIRLVSEDNQLVSFNPEKE
ncbi:MAG: exodeoxyribonuclease VII small subunit [Methylophilaceae bacterium]|nr:MAG: exodeoxyribonuclease VII small subunit [Methylophilaceae bacterium]